MACNSGFAFIDGKGTLTKIAFSSSSSGLRLTGSSGRKGTDLCSAPAPARHSGPAILFCTQEAKSEGRWERGWDQRAASCTRYKNGNAGSLLKAYPLASFVFFLVTEIPSVFLKEIKFSRYFIFKLIVLFVGTVCSRACGYTCMCMHLPVHTSVDIRGRLQVLFLRSLLSHLFICLFVYLWDYYMFPLPSPPPKPSHVPLPAPFQIHTLTFWDRMFHWDLRLLIQLD